MTDYATHAARIGAEAALRTMRQPGMRRGQVSGVDAATGNVWVKLAVQSFDPDPDPSPILMPCIGILPDPGDRVWCSFYPPSRYYCHGRAVVGSSLSAEDGGPVHSNNSADILLAGTGTPLSPLVATFAADMATQAELNAAVSGLATDTTVVHKSGDETVAGVKTFTSAPAVPDNSFTEAKVTNLVADLLAKNVKASNLADVANAPDALKNLGARIDPTGADYNAVSSPTSLAAASANTLAIQQALNDAVATTPPLPVYIPPGTYVHNGLWLPPNTVLVGAGPDLSVLRHNYNGLVAYQDGIGVGTVSATCRTGGSTTTAKLQGGSSPCSGTYVGYTFRVWSGTNAGYSGTITAYDGSTQIATVSPAASSAFDNTSKYKIADGLIDNVVIQDICIDGGIPRVNNSTVARSGSTVTVVTALAHNLTTGDYVLITGETVDLTLNVVAAQVTVVDTVTYTFTLAGSTIATTAAAGQSMKSPETSTVGNFTRTGIYLDNTQRVTLDDIIVRNCTGNGVTFDACRDLRITNSTFEWCNHFHLTSKTDRNTDGEIHRVTIDSCHFERTYFGCSAIGLPTATTNATVGHGADNGTGKAGTIISRTIGSFALALDADYTGVWAAPILSPPISEGIVSITFTSGGFSYAFTGFYSALTATTMTCWALTLTRNGVTFSPPVDIPVGAVVSIDSWGPGAFDVRVTNCTGYCIDHDFVAGYGGNNQRISIINCALDNFDRDTGTYYIPTDATNHVGAVNGAGGAGGGFCHLGGVDHVVIGNTMRGCDSRAIAFSNYPNSTTPRGSRAVVSSNVIRHTALGPTSVTRTPRGATSTTAYTFPRAGAILIRNYTDVSIVGNKVFDCAAESIYIGNANLAGWSQTSRSCTVTGNQCQTGATGGIVVENSNFVSVTSNVLDDVGGTTYPGIRVTGSSYCNINSNNIASAGTDGILLENATVDTPLLPTYIAIGLNTITGCPGYGLNATGSPDHITSAGNVYYNNTTGAEHTSAMGTNFVSISGSGSSSLIDSTFRIADQTDGTKQFGFEVSGITTATTRILTVPNANGTLALLSLAQTWSALQTFSSGMLTATSPTFVTPALGTPSALVLTNATGTPTSIGLANGTGLPISTGVSGLGTNVAAFLATPSSANLRAALTDEVGTGAAYFVGGALGQPASADLTNATLLPVATGISGLGTNVAAFLATPSSANLAAAVTGETGSGALVFGTGPHVTTLVVDSGGIGVTAGGISVTADGLTVTGGIASTTTGVTSLTASGAATYEGTTVAGNVLLDLVRYNAASTYPTSGQNTGVLRFRSWDNATTKVSGGTIRGVTTEAHSATAAGTKIVIATAANGSVSPTDRVTIDQDGSVALAGALSVTGHVTLEGVTSTGATGTGKLVSDTSPVLVTPNIGVASGTSLAATGALSSSSASAGIGYATGAGSTVTQITSRSTAVTINAICGEITTDTTNIASAGSATFTVNNSSVGAHDIVYCQIAGGAASPSSWQVWPAVTSGGGSFTIRLTNNTGAGSTEALVLRFVVIKAVNS